VTGFDDSLLAATVEGGLTSVRQPTAQITSTLVRLLDAEPGPGANTNILLAGQIVVRGSAPLD
jgi:DNA-binding LacI/PurR family transcriptional regulator